MLWTGERRQKRRTSAPERLLRLVRRVEHGSNSLHNARDARRTRPPALHRKGLLRILLEARRVHFPATVVRPIPRLRAPILSTQVLAPEVREFIERIYGSEERQSTHVARYLEATSRHLLRHFESDALFLCPAGCGTWRQSQLQVIIVLIDAYGTPPIKEKFYDRYVGLGGDISRATRFHVLQLLTIRFIWRNLRCISKSTMKYQKNLVCLI